MNKYRAAILKAPEQLVFSELPLPELGLGEALVRLERANICPTDLKKYYQLDSGLANLLRTSDGLVLGHEAAGVVVALSPDVGSLSIGQHVAIDPMLPCGKCDYCRSGDFPMCKNLRGIGFSAGSLSDSLELLDHGIGGAFAEYIKLPAQNLYPLPAGMSLEAGSLMEPLADVLHSLEAGAPLIDETAVVFGLGAMGLMHVRVMSSWGVERIIGIDPIAERRQKALEFGAWQALDPESVDPVLALKDLTGGLGPEVLFICSGGNAQKLCTQQALQTVRKKGRVLLYASTTKPADISVDLNQIHYGMITLTGTVGFYRRHAQQALELLANGGVSANQIRTPSLPLERLAEAFALSGRPEVVKVGIDISHD